SFELFVDLTLLLAVGLAIALLGRRWRRAILRASALVGMAYAACLPIIVPIAVLALFGQHAPLRYSPANFSIDVLNVAVPTPTLLAGKLAAARAVSKHFVSNVGEQNGYLGTRFRWLSLFSSECPSFRTSGRLIGFQAHGASPTLSAGRRDTYRSGSSTTARGPASSPRARRSWFCQQGIAPPRATGRQRR